MFQLDTKGGFCQNFSAEVRTSNKSGKFGYFNSIYTYFFHLIIAISIRFCQKTVKYLNSCQLCATIIWNSLQSFQNYWWRPFDHWTWSFILANQKSLKEESISFAQVWTISAGNCTHMMDALKANTCYFQS